MKRMAKIVYVPDGYRWRICDEGLECSITGFPTADAAVEEAERLGYTISSVETVKWSAMAAGGCL